MVRQVKEENFEALKNLAHKTFDEFVIEHVTEEGAKIFHQFVDNELSNMESWFYLEDGKEVAFLSIKDKNRISLFFTDKNYQRKGAAKELFEAAKTVLMARGIFEIQVNSSPNAVEFYKKLNFSQLDSEQTQDGITYVPMQYRG